jgi:hypothetical protein
MACMLLFYAIHFMTLKHCKHDREQHHAARERAFYIFPSPNSVELETSSVQHVACSCWLGQSARNHNKQFFTYRCASQVNYNAFLFSEAHFQFATKAKSVKNMHRVVHSNVKLTKHQDLLPIRDFNHITFSGAATRSFIKL